MSSENKPHAQGDALRKRVDDVQDISTQDVSLTSQSGTIQGTIQSEARKEVGIDLNNPGGCPTVFFKDAQLLVFDLSRYEAPEDD